ncbi:hypothetical protein ACOMHN_057995 [Nucella lapillus]
MAGSAGNPWTYTPPLSLWHLVEQSVMTEEQDEIKSMLGTSLVETTLDLHNEVQMLLEIWQDYKDDTESEEHHNVRPLPEPPHVRERLIQEICFLAESVREKSASKGMNPSVLLSRHNSQVLEYAEESKRCGSSLGSLRPGSARSSDGRQTPCITSQHASSHAALDSSITEDVSSADGKLNYLHFEEVCSRLRETLAREMEQLEKDVAFLQSCLTDDQGDVTPLSREPTLTDLKEERKHLEKDFLSADGLPNTPPVHKPPFLPCPSVSEIGKMPPTLGSVTGTKLRPAPVNSSASSTKRAPLKASHCVMGSSDSSMNTGTAESLGKLDAKSYSEIRGQKHDHAGKREGSVTHSRMPSAARAKVVLVGSVLEPRVDSAGSRSLMPTPPLPMEETSQSPRPNSAQRFRRMVMSHRETT